MRLWTYIVHRDCPAGPVAETARSQCRGPGSIPGQGIVNRPHRPQLGLGAANTDKYLKKKKKGTKEKTGKNDEDGVDDVRKRQVLF